MNTLENGPIEAHIWRMEKHRSRMLEASVSHHAARWEWQVTCNGEAIANGFEREQIVARFEGYRHRCLTSLPSFFFSAARSRDSRVLTAVVVRFNNLAIIRCGRPCAIKANSCSSSCFVHGRVIFLLIGPRAGP